MKKTNKAQTRADGLWCQSGMLPSATPPDKFYLMQIEVSVSRPLRWSGSPRLLYLIVSTLSSCLEHVPSGHALLIKSPLPLTSDLPSSSSWGTAAEQGCVKEQGVLTQRLLQSKQGKGMCTCRPEPPDIDLFPKPFGFFPACRRRRSSTWYQAADNKVWSALHPIIALVSGLPPEQTQTGE